MEILIIGGLLVALMAYLSTKIKKEAQRAYEREIFETKEFKIIKPDEFIIPLKEESEFAFEAHSKDFGEDEAEDFSQCWAVIKQKDGIESDPETFESEKIEKEVTIKFFRKILVNPALAKTYELQISLLPEYQEKYFAGIKLMLESFSLK